MRQPVNKSKVTKRRGFRPLDGRRLRYEPLEDRRLLSITVNTLVDENNGVAVGGISLRDAIAAATSGDTINFASSLFTQGQVTSQLTNGALVIDKPLTISGPGQDLLTIDASQNPSTADNGGIFRVAADDGGTGNNVAISGLTLTGGHVSYFGGAIYNFENLTISGCSVASNSASFGGAIYTAGDLTILDSNILNNIASLQGGGIDSFGKLTVQNSLISGNSCFGSFGGGIVAYDDATLTSTVISNNSAKSTGGGIQGMHGVLSISDCTLSGNSAGTVGGAAYIKEEGVPEENQVTIQNSAITSNTAGTAGGIYAASTSISLSQVTIAQNSAAIAAGIELIRTFSATIGYSTIANNNSIQFGGGVTLGGAGLTLDNSIVAKNAGIFGSDIATLFSSTVTPTYSLIGNNDGSGLTATQGVPDANGNLIGGAFPNQPIDPLLGELAYHGGPTQNYALLPGSPAIDRGNPSAVAGSGAVPQFDQRESPYARVAGGRIDIGAFESQNLSPLILVVDTLVDEDDGNYAAGDLSLREAIGLANARQFSIDTISFAPTLTAGGPASIVLTQGQLSVTDSVVINGPSGSNKLKIDASGNDPTPNMNEGNGSRVIQMTAEDDLLGMAVTINNLTLTGGDNSSLPGGGAIAAQGSLTLNNCVLSGNNSTGVGGAVAMPNGNLTVTSSTISGNTSQTSGGGIYINGNATITNSSLSGNSAYGGGAIYATKSFDRSTQLTITSTSIENNSAVTGGGIDANAGSEIFSPTTLSLNVVQSTISGNSANGAGVGRGGGGIYTQKATTEIDNSTISGNTSTSVGGGMAVYGSVVVIHNSTITKNSAQGSGSGIQSDGASGTQIQIQSSIVAGNIGVNKDLSSSNTTSFVSQGYNLIGAGSTTSFTATGDHVNSNPMLGLLANNGGPTKTHALLAGSPAIDAGDPTAVAGVGGVPATDQRGAPYTRVFNGDGIGGARIDIGAFELQTIALASSGDYNHNGRVDATDYVLWRSTKGATGLPAFTGADGDGDGTIGTGDYTVWRSHFGNTTAGSGTAGSVSAAIVDSAVSVTANWLPDYSAAAPTMSPSTIRRAQLKSVEVNEVGKSSQTKTRIEEKVIDSDGQVHEDALVAWLAAGGRKASADFTKEFDRLTSHSDTIDDVVGTECETLSTDVLDRIDLLS
jgi:predicted outer membrane repeat protein